MTETRISPAEYVAELGQRAGELLGGPRPLDYPQPLAASIDVSTVRLAVDDDAAVQLLQIWAVLAADPVPLSWFTAAPPELFDEPLASTVTARLTFRYSLGRIARLGLARLDEQTIQLHRLTQAVLRDRRNPGQLAGDRRRAQRLIAAAEPVSNGTDPHSWPAWAALLPHLLALDPAELDPRLRTTASNGVRYLLLRGAYHAASMIAERLLNGWTATLGPMDQDVWRITHEFATAGQLLGRNEQALQLHKEVLTRRREALGMDHPDTLTSASNLAAALHQGKRSAEATALDEQVLASRRRLLGDNHPDTLASASNLALDRRQAGRFNAARDLDEDVLARRRVVLGENHPDTLRSASNLAVDLRHLGEYEQARRLDEDVLARRQWVLGEDHPDTLASVGNLAIDLRQLGEEERAAELMEQVVSRRREVLGEDHPGTLRAASDLVVILHLRGQHERARELHETVQAGYARLRYDSEPARRPGSRLDVTALLRIGEHGSYELDETALLRYRRAVGDDSHNLGSRNDITANRPDPGSLR